MSFTLENFEERYKNLRKVYPDNPDCSVEGCHNPVDVTEGMGVDTLCAYHRLLFDYWFIECVAHPEKLIVDTTKRRAAFKKWMDDTGKECCDKIVLDMAKEPINWKC